MALRVCSAVVVSLLLANVQAAPGAQCSSPISVVVPGEFFVKNDAATDLGTSVCGASVYEDVFLQTQIISEGAIVTLSTCSTGAGSAQTTLAAYTSCNFTNSNDFLGCNVLGCGGTQSSFSFAGQQTSSIIRLSSPYNGAGGNRTLTVSMSGDECATAVVLPEETGTLPTSVSFNTVGYSASSGSGDCAPDTFGVDMWFVTPVIIAGTRVSVSTCGSGLDAIVAVYAACPSGDLLGCSGSTGDCATASSVNVTVLSTGPLWIRVGGRSGATGTGNLTITTNHMWSDECPALETVTIPGTFLVSNVGATDTVPGSNCPIGFSRDIFVRTQTISEGAKVTVSTCSTYGGNSTNEPTLAAYTSCNLTATEQACAVATCDGGNGATITFTGQQLPSIIRLGNPSNRNTAPSRFTLKVLVDGDECATPIVLPDRTGTLPVSVQFNTIGYSASAAGDDCPSQSFGVDAWFMTPIIAAGTRVYASTCGSSGIDAVVAVYSACPGGGGEALVGCSGSGGDCTVASSVNVIAPFTGPLWIRVGGRNNGTGVGNLTITTNHMWSDECPAVQTVTVPGTFLVSNVGATDTVPGSNCPIGFSRDIFVRTQVISQGAKVIISTCSTYGGNGTNQPNLAAYTSCNLTASETACAVPTCDAGSGTTITFTNGQAVPAIIRLGNPSNLNVAPSRFTLKVLVNGDTCNDAISLPSQTGTLPVSVQFNTVGYTASASGNDDCAPDTFGVDAWFVTPYIAGGTRVFVSTCGSQLLATVAVYSACPSSGSLLACSSADPSCAEGSAAAFTVPASGGQLWIRVSGQNGTTGVGNLTITTNNTWSDNCPSITTINVPGTFYVSTNGATDTLPGTCNGMSSDIFVRTQPLRYGATVTVSTCPADGGNGTTSVTLAAYSSCNLDAAPLACAVGPCTGGNGATLSRIQFTGQLRPAIIRLGNIYGGQAGVFTVVVTVSNTTGTSGSTGSTGTSGSSGSSGSVGSSGTTGSSGSSGSTGSAGSTGSSGSSGSSGSTGSFGTTGTSGSSGSVRSSGSTGTSGSLGTTGSSGTTGSVGTTGSSGSTGSVQSTGTTGSVGSTGSVRSTGSTGTIGSTGSTGSVGSTGSTGTTSTGTTSTGTTSAIIPAHADMSVVLTGDPSSFDSRGFVDDLSDWLDIDSERVVVNNVGAANVRRRAVAVNVHFTIFDSSSGSDLGQVATLLVGLLTNSTNSTSPIGTVLSFTQPVFVAASQPTTSTSGGPADQQAESAATLSPGATAGIVIGVVVGVAALVVVLIAVIMYRRRFRITREKQSTAIEMSAVPGRSERGGQEAYHSPKTRSASSDEEVVSFH